MTNVHAAGTADMMRAAKEGLAEGAAGEVPLLIAVTQLTSTSRRADAQRAADRAPALRIPCATTPKMPATAGWTVWSARRWRQGSVKEACGTAFLTVTPGIRYADGNVNDQARITTPQKAREIGTDYIVVGRPITEAARPGGSLPPRACGISWENKGGRTMENMEKKIASMPAGDQSRVPAAPAALHLGQRHPVPHLL